MAEFDGLDSRLRDAFAKAAEQGDSTGVADAIRSRVAAGDSGASVASSTAPGWGAGGLLGWLPVIGIVVAATIAGGAVGANGLVGRPVETVDGAATVVMRESVDALACVDGPVVDDIPAGTPVLATLRSDDGSWVGVRSPSGDGSVVWIPVDVLTLDGGQPELADLPIGGACPVVVTPTPTPEPTQDPVPTPTQPPNPAPSDTAAPSIQQWWAAPTEICADPQSGWATTSTVSALAADNVGVAGVRATWSGGAADLTLSSGTWSFVYDPPSGTNASVAITLVARDAAGNLSAARVVNVQVYSVGNCLI